MNGWKTLSSIVVLFVLVWAYGCEINLSPDEKAKPGDEFGACTDKTNPEHTCTETKAKDCDYTFDSGSECKEVLRTACVDQETGGCYDTTYDECVYEDLTGVAYSGETCSVVDPQGACYTNSGACVDDIDASFCDRGMPPSFTNHAVGMSCSDLGLED